MFGSYCQAHFKVLEILQWLKQTKIFVLVAFIFLKKKQIRNNLSVCAYVYVFDTDKYKEEQAERNRDRFRVKFILLDRVAGDTSNEETFK